MTHVSFRAYAATTKVRFDCPACGKTKRTRTFRAECTVNPFNVNEDGSVKSPDQVRKQSQAHVVQEEREFMRKPLCATCEGNLSWTERRALNAERRGDE